ncbi:MAG: hypothetical protein ACREN5_05675 [Gemmatimonadales bacterium]
MRARYLGLLAPLLCLSCDNPLAVSDCPEQVEIVVGAGPRPSIDWVPRCRGYWLLVQAPGDLNLWSIHGPPQLVICPDDGGPCPLSLNTLHPPVQYGVVPRDAYQDLPFGGEQAPSLVVGYPYTFRLYRTNATPALMAIDTFTITP